VTVQVGRYDVDASISKVSAVFDAYSTSTASITGTDFSLPLNVERFAPDAAYFTHSADSADVTINTTGRYQLVYRASVLSSGILLLVLRGRLQRDTGGGFVDVPGTISFSGGIDLLGVQATLHGTAVLELNNGDLVRVVVNRFTGTGGSTLISGGSSLTITGTP
jgi:hypothetical protein